MELDFSQAGFEAFLNSRNEPEWLTQRRRAAWEKFTELDWPNRRAEEWMRTDIRLFNLDKHHLPGDGPQVEPPPALLSEGVELAGSAVTLDSRSVQTHLDPRWADKGVLFGSLEELAAEHGELIQKHLMTKAVDPNYDRFAALHAACWAGGVLLYVPRGVCVDQPFHALSAMSDNGVDLSHLLVILEEGAEATFITEHQSYGENDRGLHCGAVELILAPRSNLRFVNLQNWGKGVWHFAHQNGVVDRDAMLQWTVGAIGSRLAKVNQHVELVGPGADCQVNGVMFTEDKQHLSYHTQQHHAAPSCHSNFLYKAALQDKSRTVWRGMIKVDPKAQKTDGYQRNDNLLLSTDARADAIPGLEILADDVRCTHGSTSGRVDEELIFYARCRGFTRREAIRAIVIGFFQQVFDRVTIESVREALSLAVARRVREYE
ncbi:FeS cluster assembly protein SufB [Lignipirellula cremea]|uniref:FeS cluster assembly protein SufB n=2 Tax=Lignipirellula cremea TaxID=2528010 RepID=A0A518E029_9BACT|nr:FeS cluster assembly protein SufB [Lignipirellula cremea]